MNKIMYRIPGILNQTGLVRGLKDVKSTGGKPPFFWLVAVFLIFCVCAAVAYQPGMQSFYFYGDYFWLVRMAEICRNGFDKVFFVFEIACEWLFYIDFSMFHLSPVLDNLIILTVHILCSTAVFVLSWRLTRSVSVGFISGLVFCLHPGGAADIFCKREIRSVMGAVLFLVALHFYMNYCERRIRNEYIASFLIFFLSILVFNGTASFTPVIFVYSYYRDQKILSLRWTADWIRKYVPFVVLSALIALIHGIFLDEASFFVLDGFWSNIQGFAMRLIWVFESFIIPSERFIGASDLFASVCALLICMLYVLAYIKGNRLVRFSLFWMILTAAPMVLDQESGGDFIIFLEYSYISRIGFSIFAGLLIHKLIIVRFNAAQRKAVAVTFSIALIFVLGSACRYRSERISEKTELVKQMYDQMKSTPHINKAPRGAHLYFLNFPELHVLKKTGVWPIPFMVRLTHSDPVEVGATITQHYMFGYQGRLPDDPLSYFFVYKEYENKLIELPDARSAELFLMDHSSVVNPIHIKYIPDDTMRPDAPLEGRPRYPRRVSKREILIGLRMQDPSERQLGKRLETDISLFVNVRAVIRSISCINLV